MTDPYNLGRFITAQEGIYATVRKELLSGRKESHWMWFIFPQIQGLGSSVLAERFAIGTREEADAYLRHPILGPRLKECARLVLAIQGRPIDAVFGFPDTLKFRSSMTLFAQVAPDDVFDAALKKYFGGEADPLTLARIR